MVDGSLLLNNLFHIIAFLLFCGLLISTISSYASRISYYISQGYRQKISDNLFQWLTLKSMVKYPNHYPSMHKDFNFFGWLFCIFITPSMHINLYMLTLSELNSYLLPVAAFLCSCGHFYMLIAIAWNKYYKNKTNQYKSMLKIHGMLRNQAMIGILVLITVVLLLSIPYMKTVNSIIAYTGTGNENWITYPFLRISLWPYMALISSCVMTPLYKLFKLNNITYIGAVKNTFGNINLLLIFMLIIYFIFRLHMNLFK